MDFLVILTVFNSLVIIGLLIAVFYLLKKSSRIDPETIVEQSKEVEQLINNYKEQMNNFDSRIEDIEKKSDHNSDVFKRVVYGLDFIVQGCKKALQIDNIETVEDQLESTFRDMIESPAEEADSELTALKEEEPTESNSIKGVGTKTENEKPEFAEIKVESDSEEEKK